MIIFEKISTVDLPFVLWQHYVRRRQIVAFNFDYDYHSMRFVRYLIDRKVINILLNLQSTPSHKEAIDKTDMIFGYQINQGSLAVEYGDTDVGCVFKKNILRSVFVHIEISRYLNGLEQPYRFVAASKFISGGNHLGVKTKGNYFGKLKKLLEDIKWQYLGTCFYLFKIMMARTKTVDFCAPKAYDHAISLASLSQIKFEGARSFDFLLDGNNLNKENTLFLIEAPIPDSWINEKTKLGYSFQRPYEDLRQLSKCERKGLIQDLLRLLKTALKDFNHSRSYLTLLKTKLEWQGTFKKYRFRSYIYTNNESPGQLAKNGYLRSKGVTSYNYSSFAGGSFLYSPTKNFKNHCHVLWAFQNPDYLFVVNEDVILYFKEHKMQVKRFHVVGSIYSTLIHDCSLKYDRITELQKMFPSFNPQTDKVAMFLDTTFISVDWWFTSFKDGIDFYEDINWVLKRFPNLYVILKPKKNDNFYVSSASEWSDPVDGPKLVKAIASFKDHPRVLVGDHRSDIPYLSALSDVVFTHCLSSTTFEALGASVDASWYESNPKHQNTLYQKVPDLIIQGRKALEHRMEAIFKGKKIFSGLEERNQIQRLVTNMNGEALELIRAQLSSNS